MPVALITGASRGFGHALASALADRGWSLIVDGRDGEALAAAVSQLSTSEVTAVAGDVADPGHRRYLAEAVDRAGRLDLLVNNASTLGPSPLPALAEYPIEDLAEVLRVNSIAPLALTQLVLPALAATGGVVVNVSSDAAVEAYPGWGGYGASKAALDHLTAVLAAEAAEAAEKAEKAGIAETATLRVYAFDPGDMRTAMHQAAFPGEDISDRPDPETVVPALLRLLDERPASGRYRASALAVQSGVPA